MPHRVLRKGEVYARTGYKRTQIEKMQAEGNFPKLVQLGPRKFGFLESEIDAWIESKIAERDRAASDEHA